MASEKWGKELHPDSSACQEYLGPLSAPISILPESILEICLSPIPGMKTWLPLFFLWWVPPPHTHLVMELRWVVSWALVLLTRGRAVTDVGFKRKARMTSGHPAIIDMLPPTTLTPPTPSPVIRASHVFFQPPILLICVGEQTGNLPQQGLHPAGQADRT